MNKTRYISFHNGNIPEEVLLAQASVFAHFNLPLEQIKTDLQHPDAIDHFLKTEDWFCVVIFDIDCILLDFEGLQFFIDYAILMHTLVGGAQNASHIKGCIDYVSPACMILTKEVYKLAGEPSFKPDEFGDVATGVTRAVLSSGGYVNIIDPTDVAHPLWKLNSGLKFGIGTTYGGIFYHAFESRQNAESRKMFVKRCGDVIRGK